MTPPQRSCTVTPAASSWWRTCRSRGHVPSPLFPQQLSSDCKLSSSDGSSQFRFILGVGPPPQFRLILGVGPPPQFRLILGGGASAWSPGLASAGLAGVAAEVDAPGSGSSRAAQRLWLPWMRGPALRQRWLSCGPAPGHPEGDRRRSPVARFCLGLAPPGLCLLRSTLPAVGRLHRPQHVQSCLQKHPCGEDSRGLNRSRVQCLHLEMRLLEPWAPSQPRLPAVLSPEAWSHLRGRPAWGASAQPAGDGAVRDLHRRLGGPARAAGPLKLLPGSNPGGSRVIRRWGQNRCPRKKLI